MDFTTLTHTLFSLLTLTFLEIVLGIDNLVFISIITQRLPKEKQALARRFGLLFALVTRLLLLASVYWLTKFTVTLFTLYEQPFSLRDILLIIGGTFLLYKGTQEVHSEVMHESDDLLAPVRQSVLAAIVQIGIFDIIFSLDSVITAIGMTPVYWIMASAIVIAIMIMLFLSEPLSQFIADNPTIKILALSFIIMIGMVLVADGFRQHIPRAYLYFAISFSLMVETFNTLRRRRVKRASA